MVRLGIPVWTCRERGRFYRSVAGRYADRLRRSRSRFRRVMVGDTTLVLDVTEFTTARSYFGNVPYEPQTTQYLQTASSGVGAFSRTSVRTMDISPFWRPPSSARRAGVRLRTESTRLRAAREHVRLNHFEQRVVLLQEALSDTAVKGPVCSSPNVR